VLAESTTILEHLARTHEGLIPTDRDAADETRAKDRFFDLHVHEPMQKIVDDRIRPAGSKDPLGVSRARARLAVAYDMIETAMATRTWAAGDTFSMADCAAAPALYYANEVAPIDEAHPHTRAYLERLKARPSVARVLREAEPYRAMFPR
jgi:glutathione S-transferase